MSIAADGQPSPRGGGAARSVLAGWRRPAGRREPWLVDAVVAVRAPALAISGWDGQILERNARGYTTAHGYYDQDRRILSRAELTVDGEVPEYLGHRLLGATTSKHVSAVRTSLDPTPDPVIQVERLHRAGRGERIVLSNSGSVARVLDVRLRVAADLADVSDVRRGEPGEPAAMKPAAYSVSWQDADGATRVRLTAEPAPAEVLTLPGSAGVEAESAVLRWTVHIPAGGRRRIEIGLHAEVVPAAAGHPFVPVREQAMWHAPKPTGEPRLDALLRQGLDDLKALLLAPARHPQDVFVAAGAPWHLTLFGRDSLWTARLLLPLDDDRELAFGTLRALARLQGSVRDESTDEEPGKILHVVRCRATRHPEGRVLPPVSYGSMDATALFVLLLVEAYREGEDEERVRALIPHARAALGWMRERAAEDGPGFIRYRGPDDGAPVNHGWKDSLDAIVDARGVRGPGPMALSEVQAYAIAAASGFARLLERVEGDAAQHEAADLRAWADALLLRFVEHFEVDEPGREPYFAIALDGRDIPVDGITSNVGHLLGTGILTTGQSAALARHLVSGELFSGWGVRTRGAGNPSFNRLSYHGGAVWAHDTAIAVRGLTLAAQEAALARDVTGGRVCRAAARTLADGLLSAGHAFGYRLPELFGGGPREPGDASPLPFPAACRPQAWSAAAGVAIWDALRRLDELDDLLGPS